METPDKKELITEISALFQAHEEPYEVGAWEDFSKQQKKKRAIPFAWIGIAAAILLVVSVLPFVFKNTAVSPSVVVHQAPVQKSIPAIITKDTLKKQSIVLKENRADQKLAVATSAATTGGKATALPTSGHLTTEGNVAQVVKRDSAVKKESIKPEIVLASGTNAAKQHEETVTAPAKKQSFEEFLKSESKSEATAKTQKKATSRWDFGVEVSPTMLQSQMNVGAGITTEYRLSKNFSLSSGVAYVALGAGKSLAPANPNPGVQSYSMAAESNKKLVSVQANIQAIDIPIALTYNVNKNLYTSVGVSYFGVFSEKRGNKYLTELEVSSSAQDISTGNIKSFQSVLSGKNQEVVTDLPLKGNSYLGFFNFSVGHKQEIFNKYKVVVEPFLKIPVGKLSTQDLNLTNGGVKLKFTF